MGEKHNTDAQQLLYAIVGGWVGAGGGVADGTGNDLIAAQ